MRKLIYLSLSAIIVTFSSCKGEGNHNGESDSDSTKIDTSLGIDTTNINPIDTVAVDSAGKMPTALLVCGGVGDLFVEEFPATFEEVVAGELAFVAFLH